MDDKTKAWKKFEHTGNIMDYLNYKLKENENSEILNCFDLKGFEKSRGINNEIRSEWNNNKGKGFK